MTQQEREVLTAARNELTIATYLGPKADEYKVQLKSPDALAAFDRIIGNLYHREEYIAGMI